MTAPPSSRTTGPTSPAPVVECLGVPITAHTRESAARHVVRLAHRIHAARHGDTGGPDAHGVPLGSDVHLSNAYTLALADRDPELHGILRSASLNLPTDSRSYGPTNCSTVVPPCRALASTAPTSCWTSSPSPSTPN